MRKTDTENQEYLIERTREDDLSALEKMREKYPAFDHVMRMQERYTEQGGNQYAAGITYFSVLSMFPLLMLAFSILAMVLAGNQELMDSVIERAANIGDGQMGDTIQEVIEQAVEQRSSVFSIGLLLALWTGLGWMMNLRMGASEMWKMESLAQNFVMGKVRDLIGLVGLQLSLVVAFAVTAIGNSGLTWTLLRLLKMDEVPGIRYMVLGVALLLALLANYVVFVWLIGYLPRGKVHRPSVLRAALIGAIAFELFKQFAAVFFSNALSNPAGALFGPIIGLMVMMYLVWRIVLYCSAWAATTPESLALMDPDLPAPAVIRVRQEVRTGSTDAARVGLVGAGVAMGAVVAGALGSMLRKK